MTIQPSNNPKKPEVNQRIDLREIAEKLEIDFGQAIFNKLTHTENKHKKSTRLFDATKNTSEVYYLDEKGKAFIKNYNSGEAYYSLTAYQRATSKDWRTAVIELGKEYNLIPLEYDTTPKPSWAYKPKVVITEKEQNRGLWLLTNPILKPLEGEHLEFWTELGITEPYLEKAHIQTLVSFDLVNTCTSESKPIKPLFAFAYDLDDGIYKMYQPKEQQYKWSWIYTNPENKSHKSLPYWYDEIVFTPEKKDVVFIVEGLKDCLVLNAHFNQYGIYAIGLDSAGQTLDPEHLDSLKQCCKELILCLDNDQTGIEQNQKKSLELGLPYLPYTVPKEIAKDFADLVLKVEHTQILAWLQNGQRILAQQSTATPPKNEAAHSSTSTEQAGSSKKNNRNTKSKHQNLCTENFEDAELLDEIIALISSKDAKELDVLLKQLNKEKPINIAESYLTKSYAIRNNIIANRFEYSKLPEGDFRELNPDEINREFQKKNIKFSLGAIKSLLKSDFVPEYNHFIDYFKGLPEWKEGDKDHITTLAKHIKTSNDKRFLYHLKKFLVRAVACAIDTEVVNKQCLVLVSPQQNNGKSTFCRFLVPPKLSEYIAENIGTDKDSLIALCQNLFINLDELSTLNKTEINALKSVFSKDVVKVRKPYDANPSMAYRVASFIGSTNRDEFLSDETGSVRWLCFDVHSIDFEYSKLDIDLVYAQAYALYKNGFEYQMTKQDVEENEEANKKYKIITVEKEILMQTFRAVCEKEYKANKGSNGYDALSMTEILDVLQGERKVILNPYNLTQALKDLGFVQGSVRKGGGEAYKKYLFQNISNLSTNDVEDSQ